MDQIIFGTELLSYVPSPILGHIKKYMYISYYKQLPFPSKVFCISYEEMA